MTAPFRTGNSRGTTRGALTAAALLLLAAAPLRAQDRAPLASPLAASPAAALSKPAMPAVMPPAAMPALAPVAPFAAFSRSAESLRDSLVALARAQIGKRYVWGGESPKLGFDCSGLVQYVLSLLDVHAPRTAAQLERFGVAVPKDTSDLRPGDLVTFGRGKRASHIGIYVGNGRFIHASSAAGRVVESRLQRPPSRKIKPWRAARRVVLVPDSTTAIASSGDVGHTG